MNDLEHTTSGINSSSTSIVGADMIVEAWFDVAHAPVGYPMVNVRDIGRDNEPGLAPHQVFVAAFQAPSRSSVRQIERKPAKQAEGRWPRRYA